MVEKINDQHVVYISTSNIMVPPTDQNAKRHQQIGRPGVKYSNTRDTRKYSNNRNQIIIIGSEVRVLDRLQLPITHKKQTFQFRDFRSD